ncbi:MAG: class I SAM-dependent methyltransferase [Chloroflexota bacterium]
MDLATYYDDYWRHADDTFDHERLELLAKHVAVGQRVIEVDCGPGVLAAKLRDRGANVVATDLSLVAVERARAKGIPCTQVDLDTQRLPFADGAFDVVVSNSAIEHRFFPERHLDECARVLKPGGRLILCLPNVAHLLCRWWLLWGRFPYLPNSPTDAMHLRFFTVVEGIALCRQRGIRVTAVDGSASLWARDFYPPLWRKHRLRPLIAWLAHVWPALFGRDFVLVGCKEG